MRYFAIGLCILVASCSAEQDSSGVTSATASTTAKRLSSSLPAVNGVGALTLSECTRLVHRTFFNIMFAKTSPPHSALETKMIDSCMAGQSFFNRGYYNCIFATKYSNTLDCAYAAKGIDRKKSDPLLAAQEVGEEGFFEGSAKEMEAAIYHGQDPRTTIVQSTLDRYLDERDSIDRSLGERPPADRSAPLRKSASHVDSNGQTYWIVREDFTELQLAKIMHQDANGSEAAVCAQFGNSRPLRIDEGYCGAMIKKYFHTSLADLDIHGAGNRKGPEINAPSKPAVEQKQGQISEIAAGNSAIDRQIPAIGLKVVETELACLRNKQAVDRMKGNVTDLLSDRVRLNQAEQDRTVTLHNAVLLHGRAAAEQESKRWAKSEIEALGGTTVRLIQSAGGDAGPCEKAVNALRDAVNADQ